MLAIRNRAVIRIDHRDHILDDLPSEGHIECRTTAPAASTAPCGRRSSRSTTPSGGTACPSTRRGTGWRTPGTRSCTARPTAATNAWSDPAIFHDNDHRDCVPFGDQVVENEVRPSLIRPCTSVLAHPVLEV
jgi:hypothetical protein